MVNFSPYIPKDGETTEQTIKNLYKAYYDLTQQMEWLTQHLNNDNIDSLSFSKLSGGSIDLTEGVTVTGEKEITILDEFGLDPRFLKWFPNKCYNSSFEVFDNTTKLPKYWDGGVSTDTAAWDKTYSMKLTPAQTSTQTSAGGPNPQWWDDISKMTRVSFHKKGGAVTVSILDGSNADTPFEIYKQEGNHGTSLIYPYNANWSAGYYSITFIHASCTDMKIKFENSDGTYDAYIDGVMIEPDYTRKKPSAYSDGPHSIGTDKGEDIMSMVQLYVQASEPTDAIEKDVWIDTDDYSRYDIKAVTGATALLVSDNEYITCSGTFNLTLHAGTSAGIIKWVNNIGTGIITILGTIDGVANMKLYPTESVKLITDGTNWRT